MSDGTIIDFANRLKARDQRGATNIADAPVPPDAAGRANVLSRDLGVPADFADRNLSSVERKALAIKAREAIQKYPTIGMWADDPRNAATASDDIEGMVRLSKTFVSRLTPSTFSHNPSQLPGDAELDAATATPGVIIADAKRMRPVELGLAVRDMIGKVKSANANNVTAADLAALPSQAGRAVPAGVFDLTAGLYGAGRAVAEVGEQFSPSAWAERKLFGASLYGTMANFFADQQKVGNVAADYVAGAPARNRYMRDLVSGVRSVPASAGAIALSAAGHPELGSGLLATSVGGGEYGRARAKGIAPVAAAIYGVSQGAVEFATERVPALKYFEDTKAGAGFVRKLVNNLGSEMPQEQVATVLQDMNEWAVLNPDKSLQDYIDARPNAALSTAIATAVGSTVSVGSHEAIGSLVSGAAKAATKRQDAAQAEANAAFLQDVVDGVTASKVAKRDPSAFAKFLAMQAQDSPVENIYVPADKMREFFQSNDMDYRSEDSGFGFDSSFADQYEEALASGGDIVIPTADFATHLAGTPAWDALKDHVRLSPGGMSLAEARDYVAAEDDARAQMGDAFERQVEEQRAAAEPREKLYQAVRDKLTNAGFTQNAADTNAALVTARYATRAARRGEVLTGAEFDNVAVNHVLPARLAPIVAADQLDLVIDAMKRSKAQRSDGQKFGPTLLEWIASQGGIEDKGGDLKAMGVDAWHKGKPGRKKLLREVAANSPTLIPMGKQNANTPDELALRAQEAGFFPVGARPSIDALFEAISEEMAGRPTFAEDRTGTTDGVREAADELAALLDQEGVDPDTASKADIRKAVERYQAERIEGAGFDQEFNDGARGSIRFMGGGYGAGPNVIQLFESRNPSTFLHETGHLWLEELRADAEADGSTDQVKADWQAVQDWFTKNGFGLTDGAIPVDAHELWARGVERFLMEGKAPSSALRRVFDTFRSWLLAIYQVVGRLHAPISDEIRDVMSRLIATDAEIAEAREEQGLKALFTDAAQAGMTEPVFAEYQKLVGEARDEALDALLYRTMSTIRRERTKAWKEERDSVRAEVAARVDARPEFRALKLLRGKAERIRLDRAWLVETYGEDALALLPKGVPPIFADVDTTAADAIAELSGFANGDALVRTLMSIGERTAEMRANDDQRSVRQALIEDETAAIMRDRHGDPLSDGSIEEEALALVHNDRQGEVIASELRALGARSNRRPTPYALARQWAAETIAQSKVADSLSGSAMQRYARAARNAAKLAEESMLKGDVDETFRQKQRQMLNNALIAEAGKAKAAVDAAAARLAKVAKRATIKSVDQDYLDQAHGLLEQVDLRTRSQRSIDRQTSFEAWANERQTQGFDIVVPPSFAETLGRTHWSRLTVENLLGLRDAVDQVIHLGRQKQALIDRKEQRDFDAVVGEAQAATGQLPPRPPASLALPSFSDRIKAGVERVDASLLKVETIVDWLDGGKADGVFNRIVFAPIAAAQDRENDMLKDYQARVVETMRAMPAKTIARWQEQVAVPELEGGAYGGPRQRQQLVAMALNMGNAGNIQRLTDGYGWSEQTVRDVLDRELRPDDWRFVQQVWDIIDTLWPQIEAMEKRINGVAPEKVAPVAFSVGKGEDAQQLRGGYYPAIYDSSLSIDAEVSAGRESDLFETLYTRANTAASATKARAENVKRPILLNLGGINRHLGEVIHDLTHREAIMQADKFLSDRRIIAAIDGTLGAEYRKQFRPWLKFVANQWAMERAGNEGIAELMSKLRTNTTVVGMGFRISTMLTQIAGYSNSFEAVGARWVAPAIASWARHPITTSKFVMERSGEIRHRMDTIDRDIRTGIAQLAGKDGFVSEAKRFAFHGIGLADHAVVIPTWIGAYNKALAAGSTEEAAIYEADKAVRQSQGSGSAKDLAAIQRGTGKAGELFKYLTMFYSYMSALYQRQRTLGRDVRSAGVRDVPALISRALWLVMIPPVLSGILGGHGPDDDEDWGVWAFKQMLFNALGPIPVVRDIAQPLWDKAAGNQGFGYQLSPVQRAMQTVVDLGGDVGNIVKGDETKRATRNALETVGYSTGLVPGQVAAAIQFMVDVGYGEQDPKTAGDWYEGLTKGKLSEK